jgi:REP element-mobilizing transposase RayT
MGRLLRIEYPGALYHITSRGNEGQKTFLDEADRLKFLEIIKDYHDRYGILIHSYVLMDNHYHLVLETPMANLVKVMHGMNGRYTSYFNRTHSRSGHLFQGRYKAILVDKEPYLLQLSRYVHLNPVRAGVVEHPESYQWSSYAGYIGKGKKYEWIEYSWVLGQFGSHAGVAGKKYRIYTEEALEGGIESPLKNVYGQVMLGGDEFVKKIRGMLKGKPLDHQIVERKRLKELPPPHSVIKIVTKAFGAKEAEIREKGKRNSIARKTAIYLVQRYTGLSNEVIGKLFGGIHFTAVSKVSARLREEMQHDKTLARLVGEMASKINA